MTRKISELSPKEVLAIAIRIEQANGKLLRHFAEAFDSYDKKAAERFLELAEEEDLHETWLTEKFRRRFKGPIPPINELDVEGVKEVIKWNELKNKPSGGLEAGKIYQLALEAENRARIFYQEAGSIAADKSLVLLFRQLAKMENDHAGWLENKINTA
jgi:erythrin-vacuolar iron transport family protein